MGVVKYPWTPGAHCRNQIFNNVKTHISLHKLLTVLEYTCCFSSLNTINGKMFKTRTRITITPTTAIVLANTAVDTVSRAVKSVTVGEENTLYVGVENTMYVTVLNPLLVAVGRCCGNVYVHVKQWVSNEEVVVI